MEGRDRLSAANRVPGHFGLHCQHLIIGPLLGPEKRGPDCEEAPDNACCRDTWPGPFLFMGQRLLVFIFIMYFIFGCAWCSLLHRFFSSCGEQEPLFVAVCGLPIAMASGCGAQALGARALGIVARGFSSCGSWALEHRVSSCGARAELLRGMWDLPEPGVEPMSPALAGESFTTEPPGKPTGGGFQIKGTTASEARCLTAAIEGQVSPHSRETLWGLSPATRTLCQQAPGATAQRPIPAIGVETQRVERGPV